MSLIRNSIGFVLAVFLIAFAVFNRQNVELTYSPFHDPVEAPLYLISLGLMALGFIFGGMLTWLNGGEGRRVKRSQRKKIKELEKELEKADPVPVKSEKPPSDFFPALPKHTS